jgi:hypothetical protein
MSTNILGILGQVNPAAGVLTTLYTVPANTTVAITSLFVTNLTSSNDQFSISVASNGAADTLSQYLYYTVAMDGQDTFTCWTKFSLVGGDVIRCLSGGGNLSFNVFGASV